METVFSLLPGLLLMLNACGRRVAE